MTFAAGSVFDANLTNAGCGQLDITGTVNLANSALDVASTPTQTQDGDAFVLVRNEGVLHCGTFSNFPTDGGAVNAGYVITYSYNAATGTPGRKGRGPDFARPRRLRQRRRSRARRLTSLGPPLPVRRSTSSNTRSTARVPGPSPTGGRCLLPARPQRVDGRSGSLLLPRFGR